MSATLIERLRHFSKLLGGRDLPEVMSEAADHIASLEAEREALRVALADCEQHILALYNSISPHAEYVIDGKTGNRFADKEPCVIAARALSKGGK